jgi:hypothetical protein
MASSHIINAHTVHSVHKAFHPCATLLHCCVQARTMWYPPNDARHVRISGVDLDTLQRCHVVTDNIMDLYLR